MLARGTTGPRLRRASLSSVKGPELVDIDELILEQVYQLRHVHRLQT